MNVEVLSLAIEKRYFKNFEKSALHNWLYAVIYWCKGEVYMISMTKLMTTAIDTLEKYNKGYETGRYSTEEIVFQENNPLRGNIDRELHITEDEENEGGYILAMYSNNKEQYDNNISLLNSKSNNATSSIKKNAYLDSVVTQYKNIVNNDVNAINNAQATINASTKQLTGKGSAIKTSLYKKSSSISLPKHPAG